MSQQSKHDESVPDPSARRGPRHAAPEGAGVHPLIDLSRDPTPGVADHSDHALPEDED
jgi:hypothetical protein